jgi:deoxyxylulose-5-phosphate synthase
VAKRLPHGCPIVTLEEEIRAGGMGMLLTDALGRLGTLEGREVSIMATDDRFGIQNKNESIYKTMGIDALRIAETVKGVCPILQKGSF